MYYTKALALIGTGVAVTSVASAAEIFVSGDLVVSQTWTADNTYNLVNQVYVKPGVTLTIEAGTVVASTPTPNGSGSLAVTRGGQIFVNGTQSNPVIMTSTADVATWDLLGNGLDRDPKTGEWREAANEWGNLTIMGRGYISDTVGEDGAGNVPTCDAMNTSEMEGLTPDFSGDPDTLYGGGDDEDDSGSISYLSIRYGGRVLGLANELNGLSLGALGRATDIHHVEIMNNVDDGVEVWGGTVNLKYLNIWNVGDDSLDIDQGYRGKVQFVNIVQGYSLDASQGSGVGDNCIETDGAENSDAQPVTTTVVHNATVIGQPAEGAGDGGTAWRDNARVQYRECIFMDLGAEVVQFDNLDGDGSQGYGFNGTLTWPQTWTTLHNNVPAHANDCDGDGGGIYQAQSVGFLAGMVDNVFFRNLRANAYDEATARGVFAGGLFNVIIPGFEPVDAPIVDLQRAGAVTRGGKTMFRVIGIDPRAANEATASQFTAPDDGFFTPAQYRGAFAPEEVWLCDWTATDAYEFLTTPREFCSTGCDPENGDVTGDGCVSFADVLDVLGNWDQAGDPGLPGDANCDGTVSFADILLILGTWGEGCP